MAFVLIWRLLFYVYFFFFFNDTATTEIYTLSLHDALPICLGSSPTSSRNMVPPFACSKTPSRVTTAPVNRSEEHTSELQSLRHLVCRLLLEKKKGHGGSLALENEDAQPYT